jgi:oligosaccharide repeat unit polymerase
MVLKEQQIATQLRRTAETGKRNWDILTNIPYIRVITSIIFALVVLVGLIKSLTIGVATPFLLPLLAVTLSTLSLLFIDFREKFGTTYMRIGFHVGMLVFLCAYPVLVPEAIKSYDENVRFTAGLSLVLCIIFFEMGYWVLRTTFGVPQPRTPFLLLANNYSWTNRLLFLGLALFALFLTYAVASTGRSLYSILFVLRSTLAVNQDEVMINADENRNQIAYLIANGRFMAAAAATILLLSPNPLRFPVAKTTAWIALVVNAFYGLNSGSGGSRSSFLLSAVPLITTAWIYAGTYPAVRQFRPVLAIAFLILTYLGFQYLTSNRNQGMFSDEEAGMRLDTVEVYDTGMFNAFAIYSDYEMVIGGFPNIVEFQNGASIVPIVLGWVPRRFWPDKPYPFTHAANKVVGFDVKTVSIAAGFPAEGYGNFGYAGVILWAAVFGMLCAFADYRLTNLRPGHPLSLVIRGMMAVWAAILVRGGTAEMFYMGVFPIGFMWVCLYFSDPRLRKTT